MYYNVITTINWFIPMDDRPLFSATICANNDKAAMTVSGNCAMQLSDDDVRRTAMSFVADNLHVMFMHDIIKILIAVALVQAIIFAGKIVIIRLVDYMYHLLAIWLIAGACFVLFVVINKQETLI